jgi:hypothetical protein
MTTIDKQKLLVLRLQIFQRVTFWCCVDQAPKWEVLCLFSPMMRGILRNGHDNTQTTRV